MALPRLENALARRVFLSAQALAEPPVGPARGADLLALIRRLGFVQVDSINTVERAHHMILWTRRQSYRPEALKPLLERDRLLFEHWTHDAAIIPTEFLPFWQLRFARDHARLPDRWEAWQGRAFRDKIEDVLVHVRERGPVGSGDVGTDERRGTGGWWEWHPSKAALEYLWRAGRLAVSRRDGFAKIYDLAERVYPACAEAGPEETLDWACRSALERLGFATSGEIAAFWGKIGADEAKAWCAAALARGEIAEILVAGADGSDRRVFCFPGLPETAPAAPDPPDRIRILSPFDPALRDRARTERLFGFHYRIEVFVPEARRRYGYYVFPVLEGARLIGRIDLKCRREEGKLAISAFWPEPGVRMGRLRLERLTAELGRLGRFAGCPDTDFATGWMRDPKVL
ncbi:MAG: YcaQ family DNA glycosylase [Proteobacteria bacterium]|nr:YcaQ family DNA glycosylase [Pseudomonadota bacterium]MBS0574610.1 YcaQ family DNA glycosylase [Pseudomonadota bacterium]